MPTDPPADRSRRRPATEAIEVEARRYARIEALVAGLGGTARVEPVPIPLDGSDGFVEAYDGCPGRLLEPGARRACSAWSLVAPAVVERFERMLREDLRSGRGTGAGACCARSRHSTVRCAWSSPKGAARRTAAREPRDRIRRPADGLPPRR